jgi:hypothetical protein
MSKLEVDTIAPQSGTTVTLGEAGDTVNIPSGVTLTNSGTATGFGISWQSAIKTASFTAVAGEGYWINTTSAAVTVTLPASASVGDTIEFTDYARTWGTNNLTINQNSLNYQGNSSPNPVYDVNGQHVRIVYSGATQGWIPTVDDDVTLETPQAYSTEFLVIAGGGGSGWGGGGAGGYRNSYASETSGRNSSTETPLSLIPGTTYTITVGSGGTAGSSISANGGSGEDSSISGSDIATITATGGGGGGRDGQVGLDGGAGGGASNGGSTGGSGTANQGFDGGATPGATSGGSGGGGASANGSNAPTGTTVAGGAGGNGLASSITGSSVTRAGGGGGGARYDSGGTSSGGTGGSGGGGAGGDSTAAGNAGSANTGGGAGGGGYNGSSQSGATGGSGVVILRMATADYSGTTTGSPTVSTSGTDTILVYNGDGSYTG